MTKHIMHIEPDAEHAGFSQNMTATVVLAVTVPISLRMSLDVRAAEFGRRASAGDRPTASPASRALKGDTSALSRFTATRYLAATPVLVPPLPTLSSDVVPHQYGALQQVYRERRIPGPGIHTLSNNLTHTLHLVFSAVFFRLRSSVRKHVFLTTLIRVQCLQA
ncbi:hypothetical protein K438DRAFT_1989103 [Mycena galopus ATCC 62051]|nr:hypothetical protein K438DRAFT_1989103 [Mycena galopus ATCC 62051]